MTRAFVIIMMAIATMINISCDNNTIYNKYIHVDTRGWGKNETMEYNIDSVKQSGTYDITLGLRINDSYPFQNLNMLISQTILTRNITHTDTLTCNVTDKHGKMQGNGVSLYQYNMPLATQNYQKGDIVKIKVTHNMKREVLPGIVDIGIIINKKPQEN